MYDQVLTDFTSEMAVLLEQQIFKCTFNQVWCQLSGANSSHFLHLQYLSPELFIQPGMVSASGANSSHVSHLQYIFSRIVYV